VSYPLCSVQHVQSVRIGNNDETSDDGQIKKAETCKE
jgi:hypothetical protein